MTTQQINDKKLWPDTSVLEPNPLNAESEDFEDETCIEPQKRWFSISLSAGLMLLLIVLMTMRVAKNIFAESFSEGVAYILAILTILIIVALAVFWNNRGLKIREQEKTEGI
jgi:hypothetical protein